MIAGSIMKISNSAVEIRNAALIGRVMNIIGSPRESSSERVRFSSIIGPRTNARIIGAGSSLSFMKT